MKGEQRMSADLNSKRGKERIIACVELCREIGNSAALRPFTRREVMPGNLKGAALEGFIRDAAMTYWHETCTAKMGRDPMSVVDGHLNVYGVSNLRVADGSILPQGVPHAYKVEGSTPLKVFVITSPGGTLGFEHFVEEMGTPAQTNTIPAPSPPDMEKLQRLATKYEIEFVELP
jgi:hypothetical protein